MITYFGVLIGTSLRYCILMREQLRRHDQLTNLYLWASIFTNAQYTASPPRPVPLVWCIHTIRLQHTSSAVTKKPHDASCHWIFC